MTPYAVLLVKPSDGDELIRKAYHAVARMEHPDREVGQKMASELWYEATAAYAAIKTFELRRSWSRQQSLHAKLCAQCEGFGVVGTRLFKSSVRVCASCAGNGRGV